MGLVSTRFFPQKQLHLQVKFLYNDLWGIIVLRMWMRKAGNQCDAAIAKLPCWKRINFALDADSRL